jgi:hypothetical protein
MRVLICTAATMAAVVATSALLGPYVAPHTYLLTGAVAGVVFLIVMMVTAPIKN